MLITKRQYKNSCLNNNIFINGRQAKNVIRFSACYLSLLSSLAQEESHNISSNCAWGIRSKYRKGIPHLTEATVMGYDTDKDGKYRRASYPFLGNHAGRTDEKREILP